MNHLSRFGFTAFLDLVCCGFGAATLLFLLAATATPEPPAAMENNTLLVRCSTISGAKAEVGIEYLAPEATEWRRSSLLSEQAGYFNARSAPDAGGDAFLILFAPQSGRWEFRPYLIDFAHSDSARRDATVARLEIYGNGHKLLSRFNESKPLPLPGCFGETIVVRIGEAPRGMKRDAKTQH